MLFNSLEFAIFLPIVFILYWSVANRNLKIQNFLLVAASYFFYGWWDWRFLSLIFFSSMIDFVVGLNLAKQCSEKKRKMLLFASIFVNIGFLGLFKYYNFFIENFVEAFSLFGHRLNITTLSIILPVGISFYTFQSLSYSIDVYKKKLEPTKDIVAFFAYVSFFPQLVAGPIERASNFLVQFYKKRQFEYEKAVDGMRQILWGLFKKMVIADNCAIYVDKIFANHTDFSGATLLLGATLFAFQIYGDFSGYSDIAIGTARLFGFNLMRNFAFPYFSRDIAEFWRRWHISLTTWFRDYLYIPIGGSKGSIPMRIRNIFIIFLVSGFWHGANWTYIVWGFINACYFIPLMLSKRNRKNLNIVAEGHIFPSLRELFQIGTTFFITIIAWIFFRAENLSHAFGFIQHMFQNFLTHPGQPLLFLNNSIFIVIFIFIIVEWLQRGKQHCLQFGRKKLPKYLTWSIYLIISLTIFSFGNFNKTEFIYFAF